ncbi:Uncharacterised protein [Bordetella trematum]|uniref:Uncharacterized protein n=1 Tax=Bordetella trematum TaxID=123899 RepID=A0A157RC79_9BORD|nr:hypothetical protein [Bordetella trematum]NNH18582.1 hypothetical protein [Bordetella trematum]SAI37607.1 Uncharacterised protein [Bordetella trematum]SAI55572.1 Uncharacterised protein [Bordetella trematum]SAI66372.1 Uncharacterised protein [Bordetella trematum]SPU53266.1 Uncharacterised protein [Bordetella trematum]
MRPHNGWWKTTTTPRRWLDTMRVATPQPSTQEPLAAEPAKVAPTAA